MIPQRQKPTPAPNPVNASNNNADDTKRPGSSGNKKTVLIVVAFVIIAIGLGAYLIISGNKKKEAEKEQAEEHYNQLMEQERQYDEIEELEETEIPEIIFEEEDLEISDNPEEEILKVVNITDLYIVEDDVPEKDNIKETETAIGTVNFDQGTEDLKVVKEHKSEIVVQEEKSATDTEKVYTSAEQMPQFPGGEAALLKYVSEHIKYPLIAQENNVQGRVVVQFVVKKDGSIGDIKVVRGKDPDLDKEAVRLVKTFPKFVPGRMNGQAVNVWYTLPINFKLQGE